MSIYTETQSGAFTLDGMTIPNDSANRHYQQMQQEVIDLVSTITLYAGSVDELSDAIASKQQEIASKFQEIESVDLVTANDEKARYITPATIFTATHLDNIGMADVAIVFVGALVDVATVNAYDVDTDPNWS